jgi:hypothetical protein
MVSLTIRSGTVTLILGAVVAGLEYVASNSPEYAAIAGLGVTIISAFIDFEKAEPVTTIPAPSTAG